MFLKSLTLKGFKSFAETTTLEFEPGVTVVVGPNGSGKSNILDAILNARPEERRLVIEEAAGVLKFRRRKEKAQRRLEATEANLVRINDLLREVRRQLRPLERQADAARRHGDVVAELRALRLH